MTSKSPCPSSRFTTSFGAPISDFEGAARAQAQAGDARGVNLLLVVSVPSHRVLAVAVAVHQDGVELEARGLGPPRPRGRRWRLPTAVRAIAPRRRRTPDPTMRSAEALCATAQTPECRSATNPGPPCRPSPTKWSSRGVQTPGVESSMKLVGPEGLLPTRRSCLGPELSHEAPRAKRRRRKSPRTVRRRCGRFGLCPATPSAPR